MLKKFAFIAVFAAGAAFAQQAEAPPIEVDVVGGVNAPMAIAVPPLATPRDAFTSAGQTGPLGIQMAEIIANNLRSSGAFVPVGPQGVRGYTYHEAAAPVFPQWRATGTSSLVTGFVEARPDGRLTVGCYLYDVTAGRELTRQGYVVAANDWRRAAHRCSDAIYARLSGQTGMFDTRIVYVAETGPKTNRVKRIAIMDADGSNHRYLTEARTTVLTPRFSPDGRRLAYMSYAGRRPRIWVLDIATGQERLLVHGTAMTFAPRFSPDGRQIVFSMAVGGNTDIYIVDADGYGEPRRLTDAAGADTSPSFSPDGRRIVFESDRSGTQQLYVMNSDGSAQRRISFTGGARYASPVWSPRGDLIAFTRIGGGAFRIGVMSPSGSGERILTNSWQDEGPSWAPNGEFVMFHRTELGSGRTSLHAVSVQGGDPRRLITPQDGSDPSWSPLQN